MDMYWGSNLERLKGIKQKYDPNEIFTCLDCVCNLCDSAYSSATPAPYIPAPPAGACVNHT